MSDDQGFPRLFGDSYAQPQQQQQQQQQSQQEEKPPPKRRGRKRDAASLSSAAGANADDGEDDSTSSMVFPVRLHRMLTLIDEKGTSSTTCPAAEASNGTDPNAPPHDTEENPAGIVSWQPHGRCFLVHDKDAFTQRFLPSYFRQSKWASFQRQLNIYGFQRLTAGRDRGAYYHDMFVKGHPELATRIQRMKLKGIGQGRHRTNAELEPNFYRMAPIDRNTLIATGAGVATATTATNLGQPPTLSALSAVPAAIATQPTANSALSNATTVNLLQLFQGTAPPGNSANAQVATQGQATVLAMGNIMNQDLSNLFFITNATELTSLQQSLENNGAILGNANATGGGVMQQPQQQDERQSTQQALMLANMFNSGAGVGGATGAAPNFTNNTGNTPLQQLFALDNSGSIHQHNTGNTPLQQLFALDNGASSHHRHHHNHGGDHAASNATQPSWTSASSTSNYLGASNSNLLLQSAGDLNTAALMQYFSDNSPDRDSAPDPPATGLLQNPSAVSQQQVHQQQAQAQQQHTASGGAAWSNLAAATGLGIAMGAPVASGYDASSQMVRNYERSDSNSDLSNLFQFEGPSMRRMSAAAMSTLLSILGEGNNDPPGATTSVNDHPSSYPFAGDANQNLLLFSTLHHSRNLSSSNNLFYHSALDASMNATTNNSASASQPGPAPTTASQQLALLNAATAAGNSANATNSYYVYSDPSRAAGAANVSHPTFLDSVYEPIPIKENPATGIINQHQATGPIGHNNSPEVIGTGDAAGPSQQHKLSPQAAGAGTDPTNKAFVPGTHFYDHPS